MRVPEAQAFDGHKKIFCLRNSYKIVRPSRRHNRLAINILNPGGELSFNAFFSKKIR